MRPLVVHLCIIGILMKHLSGYGIFFFPKIRCTGIKRTAHFKEQRLISQKEGFGLLTVYIANSCNCDLISFICDNVGGI